MGEQPLWARLNRAQRGLLLAGGVLAAWGPGIVVGVVLWITTGHLWAAAIGFAVLCAITSIVLGSIGARMRAKRERRQPNPDA